MATVGLVLATSLSTFMPYPHGTFTFQSPHQVLKALGRGSYGTVYKVQRLVDGQVYAMKETDIGKMSHQERTDAGGQLEGRQRGDAMGRQGAAWGLQCNLEASPPSRRAAGPRRATCN